MKALYLFTILALAALFAFPGLALAGDLDNPVKMAEYFNLAALVVTVASAVANLTPTQKDNQVIAWISKVVDFLALNWRRK